MAEDLRYSLAGVVRPNLIKTWVAPPPWRISWPLLLAVAAEPLDIPTRQDGDRIKA